MKKNHIFSFSGEHFFKKRVKLLDMYMDVQTQTTESERMGNLKKKRRKKIAKHKRKKQLKLLRHKKK